MADPQQKLRIFFAGESVHVHDQNGRRHRKQAHQDHNHAVAPDGPPVAPLPFQKASPFPFVAHYMRMPSAEKRELRPRRGNR